MASTDSFLRLASQELLWPEWLDLLRGTRSKFMGYSIHSWGLYRNSALVTNGHMGHGLLAFLHRIVNVFKLLKRSIWNRRLEHIHSFITTGRRFNKLFRRHWNERLISFWSDLPYLRLSELCPRFQLCRCYIASWTLMVIWRNPWYVVGSRWKHWGPSCSLSILSRCDLRAQF